MIPFLTLTLMLTTVQATAHAGEKIISRAKGDLDNDKIADLAKIVDAGNRNFLALEISLSKSGKVLRYETFLPRTYSLRSSREQAKLLACSEVNENFIRISDQKLGLVSVSGNFDACNSESSVALHFAVGDAGLAVVNTRLRSRNSSPGELSYTEDQFIDYLMRAVSASIAERRTGRSGTGLAEVPVGCRASPPRNLSEATEIPRCARVAWNKARKDAGDAIK